MPWGLATGQGAGTKTAAIGGPNRLDQGPVVADSCLMGLPIADRSKTREVSVNVSYWAGFGDHE